MILLNPGPVTLSPRVRRALAGGEDLCHREPEFYALTTEVLRSLETVHDAAGYRAVMLTGSGTCAVEAMLSTFALRNRATLVVANGVYGERMAQMLARQGKPARTVRAAWASAIDLDAVERAAPHALAHGAVRQPARVKLRDRHESVLPRGDDVDRGTCVTRVACEDALVTHVRIVRPIGERNNTRSAT